MNLPFMPLDQSMHPTVVKPEILVVDNDETVARDLQSQLAAMGYDLAGHATRGEQAIVLAGELRPDLVLVDVQLAGEMDGIATAKAIHSQFSLPVVLLVAFADDETLARARLAEPYGYIRKPFSANMLGTVVELALKRHKTERQLRQSEERLRLVLLGSRDGVWDRDLIQNEVYYSPRWFEMLGYRDNELPSASVWHSLIHPDDLGRATRLVAEVDGSDAPNYELEVRLRHNAGHYVPVLSRGFVVRDANGRAIRMAGTDTDLTSRKQLEEKQRASEQRFKTIFDAEPECVKVLGPTGDLLEMNPAGLAMLETGSVAQARSHGLLNFVLPAHRAAFSALNGRVMDGESGMLVFEIIGIRGTRRWLETHAAPMRDETGRVTMLLGVTRDITEQKQAAEALRRSHERFQIVARATNDAIWDWDLTSNALSWNDAHQIMFGYPPAEIDPTVASWTNFIHPDDLDRVVRGIHDVIDHGGQAWSAEYRFRRRDGSYAEILDRGYVIHDAQGKAVRMIGAMQDITERKQTERALAEAQRRTTVLAQVGHELAAASTPKAAAIHILDAAQQLLKWDAAWLQLSDEEQQSRVDVVNFDLIDGEIREVLNDASFGQPPSRMARRVKAEGPQLLLRDTESDAGAEAPTYGSGRRSLSLMFVPIRFAGRFIGILSIQSYRRHVYDEAGLALLASLATHCAGALQRLQSVEALQESERRYRALVEWSPEAITVHRDGIVIYANPVAIRMFGATTAEDLLGTPVLDWIHPDLHQRVLTGLKNMTEGADTPMAVLKCLKVDGAAIDVEARSTSIVYDGTPAIHVAMHDITARMQAKVVRASLEAQLRESQKMEAIGTLAGGVAHDFNNILATIMGNLELARQDATSNPLVLESLEEIRKAGSRARDLVQQILSFSRRQPTERRLIALAPVVAESVRLLRATLPARVSLEVECDTDVPAVLANANQIEQALINLVNNAVSSMSGGSGHILIALSTVTLDAALADTHPALLPMQLIRPGRTVRLAVSDDGIGMDAATLARIFEPFFTTKPVDEGTGLGLSVVHGIVQAHEGAIAVESQPRKGSIFTLYLPVSVVTHSGAGEPDENDVVTAPTLAARGGQRILYVDDDESLVFLVTRLLERRGFRVSGFTNQREALDALRADPASFDLVVTDYNMPGMSGLDVARAVRAIRADLAVAVASGFIDETLRAKADEAGVGELIFKASAVEDLCDAFARLAQTVGEK